MIASEQPRQLLEVGSDEMGVRRTCRSPFAWTLDERGTILGLSDGIQVEVVTVKRSGTWA